MNNTENEHYEVVPNGAGYQVVLMADELYRDAPGNLRRRRVPIRRYETFKTPVEAQMCADRWNAESEG